MLTWSVNTFGHNSGQQLFLNLKGNEIVWPLKNPVSPQIKFVERKYLTLCSCHGLALSLSACNVSTLMITASCCTASLNKSH